jgi:beta-N-acetylhexosaminidase
MPRLEITRYTDDTEYQSFIIGLIEKKMVVGFCIFGGTIESVPIILDELQVVAKKVSSPELLMSCDCEWGLPMRLAGGTEFPHLMALEKMGDQKGIRQVAEAIGKEMAALGMHWNFAPVADINSAPNNPIINIRAFSGDPDTVAECAQSFYEGLERAGIIATAKHFPGHGDTHVDSHQELPVINKSADEFERTELIPFRKLSAQKIPSIMTGHIATPNLAKSLGAQPAEEHLPATISPYLTNRLLREKIGFDGVIITDSLEMHGLQKVVSDQSTMAHQVFAAGADILLMPPDPVAAFNGLARSLSEGKITDEQIHDRYTRIEKLRSKYVNTSLPKVSVQWLDHRDIANNAAASALQLSGQIRKPLRPSSVLFISSRGEAVTRQLTVLKDVFQKLFPGCPLLEIDEYALAGDDPLVVLVHRPRGMLTGEKNTEPIARMVAKVIEILKEKNSTPSGIISFGDPYLAEEFIAVKPGFILRAYSDSGPSIQAAAELLKQFL